MLFGLKQMAREGPGPGGSWVCQMTEGVASTRSGRGGERWLATLGPLGHLLFHGVPRKGFTGMATVVASCGPRFVKVPRCDGGWKPRGEETVWELPPGGRQSCWFGPRSTGSEEPGNGQVLGPSLDTPLLSPDCHLALCVPEVGVQPLLRALFSGSYRGTPAKATPLSHVTTNCSKMCHARSFSFWACSILPVC